MPIDDIAKRVRLNKWLGFAKVITRYSTHDKCQNRSTLYQKYGVCSAEIAKRSARRMYGGTITRTRDRGGSAHEKRLVTGGWA